jgi:hypothetical protein
VPFVGFDRSRTQVAIEAIMRLQRGLRSDSPCIDASADGFDAQAVIRTFQDWQYEPFIRFILYIKAQPLDGPYYQERLAMLKVWADSGVYRSLLGRRADPSDDLLIEAVKIRAFELAPAGQTVDPQCRRHGRGQADPAHSLRPGGQERRVGGFLVDRQGGRPAVRLQ